MYVATKPFTASGVAFRGGQPLDGKLRASQLENLVRTGFAQEVDRITDVDEDGLDDSLATGDVSDQITGAFNNNEPITVLGLDEKIVKTLADNGLTTLGQLGQVAELTTLKGIGKPTAKKIEDAFFAYAQANVDSDDDDPSDDVVTVDNTTPPTES